MDGRPQGVEYRELSEAFCPICVIDWPKTNEKPLKLFFFLVKIYFENLFESFFNFYQPRAVSK
jgi:hypothetical protein